MAKKAAAPALAPEGVATKPYRLDAITFHYFDENGHKIFRGKGVKGAHPDGDLVELSDNQAWGLRHHLRTPEGHKIDPSKISQPIKVVIDEDIDLA